MKVLESGAKACYLVYDYEMQLPVACLDTIKELSEFLGTTKEVVSCGLCRLRKGKIQYVRDKEGHKYQTFKVDIGE